MAAKRGLGKGINSLIPTDYNLNKNETIGKTESANENGLIMVKISKVEPDKNQPRKNFSEDELNELADSIKQHGIFTPLLVQKKEDGFEIVSGERRWRAAKIAGLKEIPVIVGEYTEQEKTEIQLIENLQREALNPIEEAAGYRRLITEFSLTQDKLAESIGKNRTTITNSMRLLNLDTRVQDMIIEEKLTPGHGRTLLAIGDADQQYELAQQIFDEQLSVRETEKLIKSLKKPKKVKKQKGEALELILKNYEEELRNSLSAKVSILAKDEDKGRIEIEYFSQDELENLVQRIKKLEA
ncbi:MAG: ParB/RepB/Spo0J family partition protein [Lachnospiraceae bacterium]|nr:ParB/RepB/Spo0J family partition protein [Lachnospiraceae bacterium]